LDGAHGLGAYKATGKEEEQAIIKDLDGTDPLRYVAKKAIGPRQYTEEEAKAPARRAFQHNPTFSASEIGKAIGRSRQAGDLYIADLLAAVQMDLDLKIYHLHQLGIPQPRIANRLGPASETIRDHLPKMPTLANPPNSELTRGFTVPQVAEKYGWTVPMIWSLVLEGN